MDGLREEMAAQNVKLSSLIYTVEHLTVDVSVQGGKESSLKLPNGLKYLLIVFLSMGLLVFVVQIVSIVVSLFNRAL